MPMNDAPKLHAIIYVPGLGDSRVAGQQLAISAWKLQGVEPHLFQMNWADGEALKPKMARLLALIDRLAGEGKVVSLVGASAGGSVVVNAFAVRPDTINGVVCICGKISNKHTVHPLTYERNIAFRDSMDKLDKTLSALTSEDLGQILSLHPIADGVVPVQDTHPAGVRTGTMPVAGHSLGIAYGLTVGSFRAIRFLKKLARNHR